MRNLSTVSKVLLADFSLRSEPNPITPILSPRRIEENWLFRSSSKPRSALPDDRQEEAILSLLTVVVRNPNLFVVRVDLPPAALIASEWRELI